MADESPPLNGPAIADTQAKEVPSSPTFGRSLSSANFSPNGDLFEALDEDWAMSGELGELSLFEFLDGFTLLPISLDKINQRIRLQSREFRQRFKSRQDIRRTKIDENLERLRRTLNRSLGTLQATWNDGKSVSIRDKIAFCSATANILITAYLMGIAPENVPSWYTGQMLYYMPLRYFSFHRKGYHYFIADLCYWVNLLLGLFLWLFPSSSFLLIATYCLAYGPVTWAIVAWRNSLVYHNYEKVVSLFIHIMPPVVLHTVLHLMPKEYSHKRYPALQKVSSLNLFRGLLISSLVHTAWQGWYYYFIMVRRKEKIEAGRPTSFTWLRRSYAKTWIGRWLHSLPLAFQPFAFMGIQYLYSVLTMLPTPIWYGSRLWSAVFVSFVFGWSVWNGATYYIDIFGKRFQRELAELRAEVEKWQQSPLRVAEGTADQNTPSKEIPALSLEDLVKVKTV